jgi:hypothetical protein
MDMTLTCANCGFVNDTANETTMNCPNCGASYGTTVAYAGEPVTPPPPPAISFAAPFSGTPPPPQSTRKPWLIGLGVAIVVIVLLAGGLAVYAASQQHPTAAVATATPTAVTAAQITYQVYSDPQGQFSLKYPTTWTTNTSAATIQNGSVNLTTLLAKNAKGATTGGVIVVVGGASLTLQNVGDVLTPAGLTGFTTSGAPVTMTAKNGTSWQVETGTASTTKGKTAKIAAAFAQHGSSTYLVIGFGGGKGNGKVFTYMLKSMALGTSA